MVQFEPYCSEFGFGVDLRPLWYIFSPISLSMVGLDVDLRPLWYNLSPIGLSIGLRYNRSRQVTTSLYFCRPSGKKRHRRWCGLVSTVISYLVFFHGLLSGKCSAAARSLCKIVN